MLIYLVESRSERLRVRLSITISRVRAVENWFTIS